MAGQTIITKPPKGAAPQDHKVKAPKPKKPTVDPFVIDMGEEDTGPQEYDVHFLKDDEQWYKAHVPKGTMALALGQEMQGIDTEDLDAMREIIEKFLRLLFGKDDYEAVLARLDDPDDRLDIIHVRTLVKRVSEKVSNLPTM